MSALLNKLQKSGSIKHAEILSESSFFNVKDSIRTDLPILNIAFSGSIDGGLVPGLTILAGESKVFKTLLGLYCLKAYFEQYPDSVCLFYDTEFGTTPKYLEMHDIDSNRILHIPIEHVEQLKFDLVKRLESIERGEKVFIFVDSLGSLASKKEIEDALSEKSVADMSRAKAIRSLLRIITPHLTMKDIPCIIVNHVYKDMGLFPKTVIPGGTAVTYTANQIFVISKQQVKSGMEVIGYTFTLNVEKSRYVREKSKFPFTATFEGGIEKWSGLLDIALESGHVFQPSKGWYSRVDSSTGELEEKKYRKKDLDEKFWEPICADEKFKHYIEKRYQLSSDVSIEEDEVQEFIGES